MSPRRRKEALAVPREKACLLRDQIGQSVKLGEADLHAGRELAPEPECKAPHTAVAALPSATLS